MKNSANKFLIHNPFMNFRQSIRSRHSTLSLNWWDDQDGFSIISVLNGEANKWFERGQLLTFYFEGMNKKHL